MITGSIFAVMAFHSGHSAAIRYRGFLLLPQLNDSWLVRPERSPMVYLPFRIPNSSLKEVKAKIDSLLSEKSLLSVEAA